VWGRPSGKQIVIVGLGNPGKGYARHRHNVGFQVVDELARQENGSWNTNREKTLICQTELEHVKVTLAKPQTYMNRSGRAVAPLLKRENADPARMIVLQDDLDIAAGKIRIKLGGGDGGHKGIRSIADSLRFRDFIRVRLGIGRPPEGVPPDEFVLTGFSPDEEPLVERLIMLGSKAVRIVLTSGMESAQNMIHSERLSAEFNGPGP
jgi:PTH1 family peptidyl-tRNA hydrolase